MIYIDINWRHWSYGTENDTEKDISMQMTPLIKWPGGKRGIARAICQIVPERFGRYYEPFAGGAALFFQVQPRDAVLSDKNAELINLYQQVQSSPLEFIERLRGFDNSEEAYYAVREWEPTEPIERAARLYYLMLLSFNGIYRVNLNGQFNVPYGHKTHLNVVDEDKILRSSKVLKLAKLLCVDFEEATADASPGDLIYADPPYTVAHANNGFLKYNEKIFSWDDQLRLARVAHTLTDRGCTVIVSNADHQDVRQLYEDFHLLKVERPSVIAASAAKRKRVHEYVFFKGDKDGIGTVLQRGSTIGVPD